MDSVTVQDIPQDLLERWRHRAAEDRRSLNEEILHLLDLALSGECVGQDAADRVRRIDAQIRAWRRLAER
jgi:plasmid stability protein